MILYLCQAIKYHIYTSVYFYLVKMHPLFLHSRVRCENCLAARVVRFSRVALLHAFLFMGVMIEYGWFYLGGIQKEYKVYKKAL